MKLRGLVIFGLILGAGIAAARIRGGAAARTTATVERGGFQTWVDATGSLEAAVSFEVGPPSVRDFWNYNLQWIAPEGKEVATGDVIARFDTQQIDDNLRDHRASLEKTIQEREKEERNLEISLRQLRLDQVKAESELEKLDLDLAAPEGVVSSIELETARLEKELATRRVAFLGEKTAFEKSLVKTKLELLDVKKRFDESKIEYNEDAKEKFAVKAPVGGLVRYVPKRNGDRWEVGESVWMMAKIIEVADVTTLRVEVDVLEVDAGQIEPGQPAEITVDALPGRVLESRVETIGELVHERSVQDPSKVFDVILPLAEAQREALRPGMGVRVRIRTADLPDRLTVPLEAIARDGDQIYVEVLASPRAAPERRPVRLGRRNATRVVVLEGLDEGEVVLLRSPGQA